MWTLLRGTQIPQVEAVLSAGAIAQRLPRPGMTRVKPVAGRHHESRLDMNKLNRGQRKLPEHIHLQELEYQLRKSTGARMERGIAWTPTAVAAASSWRNRRSSKRFEGFTGLTWLACLAFLACLGHLRQNQPYGALL